MVLFRGPRSRTTPSARGQGLVETALILPILLILLLGAIDFGRAFFDWVNLHQAVRIGANFAAAHPQTTSASPDYIALIDGDTAGLTCSPEPLQGPSYTTPDGTSTAAPRLGDYATVSMTCGFSMVTPLAGIFFGDPIELTATSTFPIREGCVSCPTPPPATPPPTPVQCRLVPTMQGMSVAGARLAWASAGFDPDNFVLASGQETSTVNTASVTQDDPLSTCVLPYAIFSSSVTVSVLPPDPVVVGCQTVPNLIGLSVADARTEWESAGFDVGSFNPDIDDPTRRVSSQETNPASTAGVSCLESTATIDVVTGEPWPAAPDAPCEVPSMINLTRLEGATRWTEEGFAASNFNPDRGGFTIKSQSLVGGAGQWVPCTASITVSAAPG
jgi:hypothetical protein